MSKVIVIQLAYPEFQRDESKYKIDNLFFNYGFSFDRDIVLGLLPNAEGLSTEFHDIFADVLPSNEGEYTIELGAELLELYPNLEGCSEYCIEPKNNLDEKIKIYISNSMAKINYRQDSKNVLLLFNQLHKDSVIKNIVNLPNSVSIENLKTFVTFQFKLSGRNTKEIFENHIDNKINEFIYAINEYSNYINLIQMENSDFPLIVPSYSRYTIPFFYFIVLGKDKTKLNAGKIVTHPKGVAYITSNLDNMGSARLKELLNSNNELNIWDLFFVHGKSLVLNGQSKSGIISLFTCSELILSRYIHNMFLSSGVSKSKLKDNQKDITFSQMLNVHLYAFTPQELKPYEELIGRINTLRRVRNDLIHEGNFFLNDTEVHKYIGDVMKFKDYVTLLLEKLNIDKIL